MSTVPFKRTYYVEIAERLLFRTEIEASTQEEAEERARVWWGDQMICDGSWEGNCTILKCVPVAHK